MSRLTKDQMWRDPAPVEAHTAGLPPAGDVMVDVGVPPVHKLDRAAAATTRGRHNRVALGGVGLLHGVQEGIAHHSEVAVAKVPARRSLGLGWK